MAKPKDKTMTVVITPSESGAENVGVMIDGEMMRTGEEVTLSIQDARSLMHRGRACSLDAWKKIQAEAKKKPSKGGNADGDSGGQG